MFAMGGLAAPPRAWKNSEDGLEPLFPGGRNAKHVVMMQKFTGLAEGFCAEQWARIPLDLC